MGRLWFALAIALVGVACNSKSLKKDFCRTKDDCTNGRMCDNGDGGSFMCISMDASTDRNDGGDARDDGEADVPFHCSMNTECTDGGVDGGPAVCEPDAGMCVECLRDEHCMAKPKTPICEALLCRACKADSECPDPQVCMTDGHCATTVEVIFVEYKSTGCQGENGSTASPYCMPNMAVAQLANGKNVIVVRGPTNNQLNLATTGLKPVIVGRKNSSGIDASVLTGAATAITVQSDDVLIRDLIVNLGSPASKGIVVSGSGTTLRLIHVDVATGMGLGIQADSNTQLTMDRCAVTGNSVGGLLIDGAGYNIQNSIFAANGFSQLQFSSTPNPGTPSFRFNTVVAMTGNAATCDITNKVALSDSLVVGGQNCTLVNSRTTATFKTSPPSPPYRVAAGIGCPMAPASPLPSYDIDGDARTPPIDCGADQFVQ